MASLSHSCYFRAWKSPSRQDKCKSLLPHVETLGAGPGRACLAASGARVRARTRVLSLSLSLSLAPYRAASRWRGVISPAPQARVPFKNFVSFV